MTLFLLLLLALLAAYLHEKRLQREDREAFQNSYKILKRRGDAKKEEDTKKERERYGNE